MFERRSDPGIGVAPVPDLLAGDAADWTAEEWEAWSAQTIADAPAEDDAAPVPTAPYDVDGPDDRSAGDVLAAVANAPVTAQLAGRVLSIDVADLDDDGRVAVAVALSRLRSAADGRLAEVIAADVRATPAVCAASGRVRIRPESQTALAMAAPLRLGNGAADLLVGRSVALATRHPRTLAAVRAGDVPFDRAAVLVDATAPLTDTQAAAVEDRVLPHAGRRVLSRHRAAVQHAVEAVDPAGAADRHRAARRDVAFVRSHYGDGVGALFTRLPAEQLDVIWTAADASARRAKAAGDARSLEALRIDALVQWARSFLVHGDVHGDACDETTSAAPPVRHGRRVTVGLLWDLPGLLGLHDRGGQLLDTGAPLSAETLQELVVDGVRLRRMLVDPDTGELLDVTPRSWQVGDGDSGGHASPYTLFLVLRRPIWQALMTGDVTGLVDGDLDLLHRITAAIDALPQPNRDALRAMLAHPVTADDLDNSPDAYPAPAALAEFVALRDRHPMTPTAGPTAAGSGDADHTIPAAAGGTTTRDNLTSPTRRWHLARTHGRWTLERVERHWIWTSPTGRRYRVDPHDYRLGP